MPNLTDGQKLGVGEKAQGAKSNAENTQEDKMVEANDHRRTSLTLPRQTDETQVRNAVPSSLRVGGGNRMFGPIHGVGTEWDAAVGRRNMAFGEKNLLPVEQFQQNHQDPGLD